MRGPSLRYRASTGRSVRAPAPALEGPTMPLVVDDRAEESGSYSMAGDALRLERSLAGEPLCAEVVSA